VIVIGITGGDGCNVKIKCVHEVLVLCFRQVNLAITSPPATMEYLKWSDQTVGFNRIDHMRKVPRPGHAPMVLKA
jgi:hypothetical protein